MNPREWKNTPSNIKLDTKFGPVLLHVTQGNHIYVDANSNSATNPNIGLTIRGVRYGVSAHFFRYGIKWEIQRDTGTSGLRASTALYMSRSGPYTNLRATEPSRSAREAVIAELTPHIQKWADSNPKILKEAHEAHIYNETSKHVEEIEKKEAEIAKLKQEIFNLNGTRFF